MNQRLKHRIELLESANSALLGGGRSIAKERDDATQRIKRLEEAENDMMNAYEKRCHDSYDSNKIANWRIVE